MLSSLQSPQEEEYKEKKKKIAVIHSVIVLHLVYVYLYIIVRGKRGKSLCISQLLWCRNWHAGIGNSIARIVDAKSVRVKVVLTVLVIMVYCDMM